MDHASDFAVEPRVESLVAQMPELAAACARGARLLHDRRLAAAWDAVDGGRGLAAVGVPDHGTGRVYELALQSDAGPFTLAVALRDDAAVAMVAAAELEPALRALVLTGLFGDAVDRFAALALPGLRVAALASASTALPAGGWCTLRRCDREIGRIAVLQLSPGVEDALRAVRQPVDSGAAWRSGLRLPAAAVVGERRLSIATLRSLEPGDVLLLPLAAATLEGAAATLRVGASTSRNLCAAARIVGDTIALLGELRMTDHASASAPEGGRTAGALDELELPVLFELETLAIPLADLEGIEPGYVIEFDTPVAQARLRLVSCGMFIGEADLVAVAGRLGARITHLVARHDADQQRG